MMVPLRKLDESGRSFFFYKSVMHSFHTYEFKVTVNISGRHTNFHLLPLQPVSFIWPSRPSVTQPLSSLQASVFLFIHCNQIVLSTLGTINRQMGDLSHSCLPSIFMYVITFIFTAVTCNKWWWDPYSILGSLKRERPNNLQKWPLQNLNLTSNDFLNEH